MIVRAYIVESIEDVRRFKRNLLQSFDYELIIRGTGVRYQWSFYSEVVDDGYATLAPYEPGVGRWTIQPASALGPPGAPGPAGDSGSADPLELSWFEDHGLMPSIEFINEEDDVPAFDFISAGVQSLLINRRKLSLAANAFWTLPEDASAVLLVLPAFYGIGTNRALIAFKTKDGSQVPQDGYSAMDEQNSARSSIYQLPGFSSFELNSDRFSIAGGSYQPPMAAYWDLTADRVVLLYKDQSRWYPCIDRTDAAFNLDVFRYVGVAAKGVIAPPLYAAYTPD